MCSAHIICTYPTYNSYNMYIYIRILSAGAYSGLSCWGRIPRTIISQQNFGGFRPPPPQSNYINDFHISTFGRHYTNHRYKKNERKRFIMIIFEKGII